MGTTFAVVQSVGIVPCFSEAWKNCVNVGVSSSASVLSNFVGMWSGPVALCSLSVHSSLWMPCGVIVMCCMGGCGLMPLSGMVEMSSFWVNTDLKCWLSMLALVRLSDLMNPSLSCSCCIPDWSFL